MKKSTKFFGCVTAMFIMLLMLSACTNNKPNSTSETTTTTTVSTEDTSISTTVETIQETTKATTKKTTKAVNRCQYKENGKQNCQNEATHGELCDKHFNYLNDIYNGLFG